MSFVLYTLCFVVIFSVVAAASDRGYVPKGFYTLDSNGHKSDIHAISPHTLKRLRRQSFSSSSSSSSSSSVSNDGGPVYFSSQQVVHHTPDLSIGSRFGGTSSSGGGISSSSSISSNGGPVYFSSQQVSHQTPEVGFASRFGETSSKGTTGHVIQTTGVVDENGRVHYNTKEGHF